MRAAANATQMIPSPVKYFYRALLWCTSNQILLATDQMPLLVFRSRSPTIPPKVPEEPTRVLFEHNLHSLSAKQLLKCSQKEMHSIKTVLSLGRWYAKLEVREARHHVPRCWMRPIQRIVRVDVVRGGLSVEDG